MKKIISLFMLLSIIIIASSCQKERVNTRTEVQTENQFKDEEDEIIGYVPTINGQVFLTNSQVAQGVEVTFEGVNVNYYSSDEPDANGNFSFHNVGTGDYKRKTYVGGSLHQTVDYKVE